ncbi:1,2-dihydroxy-3-keto-5-methylthiopentene dioxygenase [Loxospora ochrophaea]|nr:1,2-dihydroxy-3-keto-5-methylthiopentene dioxygenase [Loxospora ochrophaea]
MRVYQYDNLPGNGRLPHDSGINVSATDLVALGVTHSFAVPQTAAADTLVARLASERTFAHEDEITYAPAVMGQAAYEAAIAETWEEHIHDEDEIRYITRGSGYFDVRKSDDTNWVRMKVVAGDAIVLPKGIYHRFFVDENDDVTMTRLFKSPEHITQDNRSAETEALQVRKAYLATLE